MGARMGAHEDWYNLTIQNCTSYTRGFMIGSGRGHLRVLNCKHYYSTNVGNVIEFRYDYSNCCDGVIEVDGLDIYLSPDMPTYSAALKFQVAVSGSTYISPNTTAKTCDSLVIKNVNIHSETTQSNNFELWNVASDFTQNVKMPDKVVISNINTSGATNTSVRLNVCGSYYSTSTKMLRVTTDVDLLPVD